jgi:hypothetical protein
MVRPRLFSQLHGGANPPAAALSRFPAFQISALLRPRLSTEPCNARHANQLPESARIQNTLVHAPAGIGLPGTYTRPAQPSQRSQAHQRPAALRGRSPSKPTSAHNASSDRRDSEEFQFVMRQLHGVPSSTYRYPLRAPGISFSSAIHCSGVIAMSGGLFWIPWSLAWRSALVQE